MEKIAVGGGLPKDIIDLDTPAATVISDLAKALKREPTDIVACILDRPRHADLIAAVREAGARIQLIPDGDVAGVIATSTPETGIDVYMGIGGAPEGVLAAAALQCIGGQMQGRLVFRNDDERGRAAKLGITDFDRKYDLDDLAHGDVIFSATGVTDGSMLAGVHKFAGGATTETVLMRSRSGTVRWIKARHDFARQPKTKPIKRRRRT